MELQLSRTTFTNQSTVGELRLNGNYECFTLEDANRIVKLAGITAIPAGNYEVVITYSERFGRPMPLILKVPDFEGVRIHWGNTDKNTDGCILVGKTKAKDFIGASRAAFDELFSKLEAAARIEKIYIAIANATDREGLGPLSAGNFTRQIKLPGKTRKAVKTKTPRRK